MEEKKIVSDEAAKAVLELGEFRLKTINRIRGNGGQTMGFVFFCLVTFALTLLTPKYITLTQCYFGLVITLCGYLSWRQRWNEQRLNALVDLLLKEGVIRK